MSGLVARQPILDSQLKTVGYELLFREGTENLFTRGDPDGATFSVMSSVIDENDLGVLANGRPLFLNFTRALLLGEYAQLLPKDMVVIEIVENLNPDEDLLASCSRLKKDGYRLALDDVVSPEICLPYLDVIDILKVDFLLTDAAMRQRLADEFLPRGIVMLAEKVETHEAWRQAEESGYTLFQGFFFSKPKMVASRQIPQSKSTEFMLIREVTQMDCDMQRVEKIIMHDPVISVKLLKYINSAAFALRSPVRSIRHALAMIGQQKLRKWVLVMAFSKFGKEKPTLQTQAVCRARFCEQLAPLFGHADKADEIFMMGLLSLIDAILDQPLEVLLEEISISQVIADSLLGEATPYADILAFARGYERGFWDQISSILSQYDFDVLELPSLYTEAAIWAQVIVEDTPARAALDVTGPKT